MALVVLGILTSEIILATVGMGILFSLAALGLIFQRRLGILQRELRLVLRLSKTGVFLGDRVEGELTIRNPSRLAVQILAVQAVVEKELSYQLSPSFYRLLRPGAALSSKFVIMPLARGRFQIFGFMLTFTDTRGLYAGEVAYEQYDLIEIYPGVKAKMPITPLRLYGESPEIFQKTHVGTDYAGTRQYELGDDYSRVEWKATARLGTLMVKEFHPETQAMLQIVVDAGRTMRQESYLATKLEEALGIAEALLRSLIDSKTLVGVWVLDETDVSKVLKPALAKEQLPRFRRLAFSLVTQTSDGKPAARTPAMQVPWKTEAEKTRSRGSVGFMNALELKFALMRRKTGMFKALREIAEFRSNGLNVVLTDLFATGDSLRLAARSIRGSIVVVQVAARWRLASSLQQAFVKYQDNNRQLERLRKSGIAVLDVRPEDLIDALYQQMTSLSPLSPRG